MRPLAAALLSLSLTAQDSRPTLHVTGRLVDELGKPLAGVGFAGGPIDRLLTRDALDKPMARSDADGRFRLAVPITVDDLRRTIPGVLAAAPGRAAIRGGFFSFPAVVAATRRVEENYEFGELLMPEGRDLRGQVLGPDGPLAGAEVKALDLRALEQFFPSQVCWWSSVVSDAAGRFVLPCVPDLPLALLVRLDGYYDVSLRGVRWNEAPAITMQKSGFLTGVLLDEKGKPAAGTISMDLEGYSPCWYWDCQRRYTKWDTIQPSPTWSTAPDGAFRIPLRLPQIWRLHGRTADERVDFVSEALSGVRNMVALEAGTELQLVPAGAGAAAGRSGTLNGRVRNADGTAARGALVRCAPINDMPSQCTLRATDADGKFSFSTLAAAEHALTVDVSGLGQDLAKVAKPGTADEIVFELPPCVDVRGKVTGCKAEAGWRIELQRERVLPPGRIGEAPRTWFGTATTVTLEPDGSFVAPQVPAGRYKAFWQLLDRERINFPFRKELGAFEAKPDMQPLELALKAPPVARVRGKVVLEGDALPWSRLCVAALPPGGAKSAPMMGRPGAREALSRLRRTRVRDDGTFELVAEPGKAHLTVADVVTGLVLCLGEARDLDGSATAEATLRATATRLVVELREAGGKPARATSVSVTVSGAGLAEGGLDKTSIWTGDHPRSLELFVPRGQVQLEASSMLFFLRAGPGTPPNTPALGSLAVDVGAGERRVAFVLETPELPK